MSKPLRTIVIVGAPLLTGALSSIHSVFLGSMTHCYRYSVSSPGIQSWNWASQSVVLFPSRKGN